VVPFSVNPFMYWSCCDPNLDCSLSVRLLSTVMPCGARYNLPLKSPKAIGGWHIPGPRTWLLSPCPFSRSARHSGVGSGKAGSPFTQADEPHRFLIVYILITTILDAVLCNSRSLFV
jgi:hypothetical protein